MKNLPSSDSAKALVGGDLSALPTAALHMLGRGVLLGTGMRALGLDSDTAFRAAWRGTVTIELFALAFFAYQRAVRA